jgi:hypothetical protein
MAGALPVHVTLRAYFGAAYTGLPFSTTTGTTLSLMIEARNAVTGQLIDVEGLRVRQERPDRADIILDADDLAHLETGRYSAEIYIDAPGDWTLPVDCDEPRPAETKAWLRASGPPVAASAVGSGSTALALPGNRPFDLRLVKDVQEAAPLTGTEGLLIAQDDEDEVPQPRLLTVGLIRQDALGTIAPQVQQVTTTAAAVQEARVEVAGVVQALPQTIAGELAVQAPAVIQAGAEAGADAGSAAGAQAAQPFAQQAEVAAANTSATVANAAIQRATLAELKALTGVADRQLGVVFGTGADAGQYRYSISTGTWARESNTVPQIDAVLRLLASWVQSGGAQGITLEGPGGFVWGEWTAAGEIAARSLRVTDELALTDVLGAFLAKLQPGTMPTEWIDFAGRVFAQFQPDGTLALSGMAAGDARADTLTVPGVLTAAAGTLGVHGAKVLASPQQGISFENEHGLVYAEIAPSTTAGNADGWTPTEAAGFEAEGLAASTAAQRIDTLTARPTYDINIVPALGQSHTVGAQARRSISRAGHPFVRMVGNCVRSYGASTTTWTPNGAAAFNPIAARVAGTGAGVILTVAEEEALPADATNAGETILEGALAMLDLLQQIERGPLSDRSLILVGNTVGVSGTNIEQWLPDAPGTYFTRFTSYIDLVKSMAPAGKTVGCPYLIIDIGQNNYGGSGGSTPDKDQFKAYVRQVINACRAYVASALGQTDPMGVIVAQPAAGYTNDAFDMAIGQAWRELAAEDPLITLGTSGYPEPDNGGGHLTANGYRQRGMQLGKALHAKAMGRFFHLPEPVRVVRRGLQVAVPYRTTDAKPLRRAASYVGGTATLYDDWGFSHFEAGGTRVDIASVSLLGPHALGITLARAPVGDPAAEELRYADKTYHVGNGNLFADDALRTPALYEFLNAMQPEENIPELVGKPYPNDTPAAAGHWPVTVLA